MKYEEYKDSGVKWIGKIPNHWEVCRLKSLCTLKARIGWKGLRSDEFEEESYAYLITGQDFKSAEIDWDSCYQINKERYEEDPYIQLSNGDLLITKDGTIGKIAKVTNLNKPACLNSGVFVLKQRKNQFYPNFLYWLLSSTLLADFNNYTSTGTTILHLYQNVFENMPVIVPHLSEQEKIASYLDKKCGKINGAIDVQKKKIDLLNELKQTIITNAVTKGLNPDAPMKDSGVAWIGQVPEHWEVMKTSLAFLGIGSGTTPSTSRKEYYTEEDGLYWLQTGDLNDGEITDTSKKITSLAADECNLKFYPTDSVVIAMYGATIGKVGLLKISTSTNQACCVLPKSKRCIPAFAFYIFIGAKKQLLIDAMGGGQPNISQDKIKKLKVSIPPISEQRIIVDHIADEVSKIDAQISKANRRIELLNELKQSIITEAVTGKIKVI